MTLPHQILPTTFNNVNKRTFEQLYDSILNSVRTASFIALDTEFSGLGTNDNKSWNHSYLRNKETAEKFSILSLGLSVVQKINNDKEQHYKCDNYNFTTLKRNGFRVETDTGLFLHRNKFSFDDLFLNGIEFEPKRTATDPKYSRLSQLWHEMIRIMNTRNIPLVVHNGFFDLIYIYESFIGILPDNINSFVTVISETFQGGVFDTKYISKKIVNEKMSYLEYLFKKYDRLLEHRFNTDKIYFKYESNPPINTPTPRSIIMTQPQQEQTPVLSASSSFSSLPFCEEFASQGYCSKDHIENSQHDINIILDYKCGVYAPKGSQFNNPTTTTTTTTSSSSLPPSSQIFSSQIQESIATNAHTAYFDSFMTSFVFCYMLNSLTPQQWYQAKNKLNLMFSDFPLFIYIRPK